MQPQTQPSQNPNQFGDYSNWAKTQLDSGVSQDAVNQALQQQQTQEQPKQSGNIWSTVGSIALPVLGGLLAPATGGLSLLGGLAGGAALSGVGGAVGKAIDNSMAGQDALQGNVLSSGLLDAAGAGVGGIAGKAVGALLPKISGTLGNAADSLLMGQAPKGMLNKASANTLRNDFNISNLSKSAPTVSAVTGSEGALNQGVIRGLQEAGDNGIVADLTNLNPTAQNLVSQFQTQLKPSSIAQVNRVLEGSHINAVNPSDINAIPVKGGGTMNIPTNGALKNVLPQDAQAITKNFETLAQQSKNAAYDKMGNVIDTDQLAKYNIFNGLAKESEKQAFGGATPLSLSAGNKAQIISELEPLKTANPQAYNHIVSQLGDTTSLNDLRSMQSPLVQASKAANASERMADVNGGKSLGDVLPMGVGAGGLTLGGPAGGVAGFAVGKALESKPAQALGSNVLGKLSSVIGNEKAPQMLETLGKISGAGAVNLPQMGAAPVGANQSVLPGLSQTNGEQTTMNNQAQPSDLSTILEAMKAQAILAPQMNPGATSFLSSYAPQLQKNALLENAVSALPGQFANAGGAQGMGGISSVLSSLVPGTAANAYQGDVSALSAQLAKALGITPEAAQNLLPGLLQNNQTAGQRQNVLGGLTSGLPT